MKGLIGFYKLDNWWLNELTDGDRTILEDNFEGYNIEDSPVYLTTGEPDETCYKDVYDFVWALLRALEINHLEIEFYDLTQKILKKADSLVKDCDDIEKHFHYASKINFYYRNRDKHPEAFGNAIQACLKQIELSKSVAEFFTKRYISIHDPISKLRKDIEFKKELVSIDPSSHEEFAPIIHKLEIELELENKKRNKFVLDPEVKFLPLHTGFQQLAIIYEKQGKYSEMIDLCQRANNEGWDGTWKNRIEKAKKKLRS